MSKKKQKGISIRMLIPMVAVVLLLGCAVGGTIAWLTAQTAPVVNTFTVGDIDIELTETTGEDYKIVPGTDIPKDPKVTVDANSEKCWLFVKVDISDAMQTAANKGVTWAYATGWTKLEDAIEPDPSCVVLYRIVDAATTAQSFDVLSGNTLTVPGKLSKADLEAIKAVTDDATLTFTAYAIQYENFPVPTTAADGGASNAWDEISKSFS